MLPRSWAATVAATAAAVLFLSMAAARRLNFDEALLLRAGRLEFDRELAEPPFLMPASLAAGATSRALEDPGALFLVLRLATAGSVLVAFGWLLAASDLSPVRRRAALAIAVTQSAFATHGLEFRYDAALLVGLLVAAGGAIRGTAFGFTAAGVALGFVALHHVKGLLVAALFAIALLVSGRLPRGSRTRCALGGAAVIGAWFAVSLPFGGPARWLETSRYFARLGLSVERTSPAEALGPTMVRDAAWWILALLALGSAALARKGRPVSASETTLLCAALVTLALVPLHPHPWPYALALPAPFLATLAASRWPSEEGRRARLAWSGALVVAVALQLTARGGVPLAHALDALRASRAGEVSDLRRLRSLATGGERVLDPSGVVYFLPPCTKQWYLDSLFQQGVAEGRWMGELASGLPATCVWAIDTYRLQMLPPSVRREVPREFVPIGGALLRHRASVPPPGVAPVERPTAIESFW